jgi:hypothetical protein
MLTLLLKRNEKGQNIAEYTTVVGLALAGVMAAGGFVRRSAEGRVVDAFSQYGGAEVEKMTSDATGSSTATKNVDASGGGSFTMNEASQRTENQTF